MGESIKGTERLEASTVLLDEDAPLTESERVLAHGTRYLPAVIHCLDCLCCALHCDVVSVVQLDLPWR